MQQSDKDNVNSIHLESVPNSTGNDTTNAPPGARSKLSMTMHKDIRGDRAAEFLKDAGDPITVTPQENSKVLRKIDRRILPIMLFIYCLQSLDKTTLSYASVFGIIEDANLVHDQFSWLGSVVYLAQLVFQPLIAYSLVRLRIGKFCATMVLCWGAVLCGMTAAHDFGGLLAARLLLGMFEASVAPTFIAIIQIFYRRSEQTLRNSYWYSMLGVVNMAGSLLAWGLGHIESSLHPYQIIFLFCGALTVAFSVVIFIFMPDSPMDAKFLTKDEKLVAIERLRANQSGIGSGVWKWDHVLEAIIDLKTWLWFSLMFVIAIPSGGISTFGPLIIESFGFDQFATILFNIPFGAVQMIATIGGALLADKIKKKSPVLLLLCLPPIAGLIVLLVVGRAPGDRAPLLVGYYLISVYPGISPLIYSWSGQNTAGDTKRKVTTGMLFVGQSAGNVIGPLLFRPSEKPRYQRGVTANLVLFVILAVLAIAGMVLIKVLNKRQEAKRVALGKPRHIIDKSMAGKNALEGDAVFRQDDDTVGGKAFDDLTDFKNEDFVYVY